MEVKKCVNMKINIIDNNGQEDYPCPISGCKGTMRRRENGFMSEWMECDKCGHKSYSFGL